MTRRGSPALHARTWDRGGSAPTLVLLHGFTQNVDCWGPFADELAAAHPLVAVDGPGHGRSGHDDADLWTTADLVAATVAELSPDPVVVIGYSMGGRTALHLALAHPSSVAGLVLIGATAGIDDPAQRAARRAADEVLATRIESEPLPAFIDAWLANPLFTGLSADTACREARLSNRRDGLAASLRHCGTGAQEPLWSRLDELTMPVLVIAGRGDTKFSALARRLAGAMCSAPVRVTAVEGTHAVHLEQPTVTAAVISAWVADALDG